MYYGCSFNVEEAQHTLLVGTRLGENGTMGSLKITRKKGQVLELEATGTLLIVLIIIVIIIIMFKRTRQILQKFCS